MSASRETSQKPPTKSFISSQSKPTFQEFLKNEGFSDVFRETDIFSRFETINKTYLSKLFKNSQKLKDEVFGSYWNFQIFQNFQISQKCRPPGKLPEPPTKFSILFKCFKIFKSFQKNWNVLKILVGCGGGVLGHVLRGRHFWKIWKLWKIRKPWKFWKCFKFMYILKSFESISQVWKVVTTFKLSKLSNLSKLSIFWKMSASQKMPENPPTGPSQNFSNFQIFSKLFKMHFWKVLQRAMGCSWAFSGRLTCQTFWVSENLPGHPPRVPQKRFEKVWKFQAFSNLFKPFWGPRWGGGPGDFRKGLKGLNPIQTFSKLFYFFIVTFRNLPNCCLLWFRHFWTKKKVVMQSRFELWFSEVVFQIFPHDVFSKGVVPTQPGRCDQPPCKAVAARVPYGSPIFQELCVLKPFARDFVWSSMARQTRVVPDKMASPNLNRWSKLPTCHLTALCPKLFPDQSGKGPQTPPETQKDQSSIPHCAFCHLTFFCQPASGLQRRSGAARQTLILRQTWRRKRITSISKPSGMLPGWHTVTPVLDCGCFMDIGVLAFWCGFEPTPPLTSAGAANARPSHNRIPSQPTMPRTLRARKAGHRYWSDFSMASIGDWQLPGVWPAIFFWRINGRLVGRRCHSSFETVFCWDSADLRQNGPRNMSLH